MSTTTHVVSDFPSFANRDATGLTVNDTGSRILVTGHGDFYPSLYQSVIASEVSADLSAFGATGDVDATGPAARFDFPGDVATDGTDLYVDGGNQAVRRVVTATGAVDTLASDVGFNLGGMTRSGGSLFLGDGNRVARVEIATGDVTTAATLGAGTVNDVTVVGSDMYVVFSNCALYKVPIADGAGGTASFGGDVTCPACPPLGITNDGANLYVADHLTVRKVVIATATVSTLTVAGSPYDPQSDITVAAGHL